MALKFWSGWCGFALCTLCFVMADSKLYIPSDDSNQGDRKNNDMGSHDHVFGRNGRFAHSNPEAGVGAEIAAVDLVATPAPLHYPHNILNSTARIGRRSQRAPTPPGQQSSQSPERYPSPDGKGMRWRFDLRHSIDADYGPMSRSSSGCPSPTTSAAVGRLAT
jgi:hypothetical protein